jgi:hypothetical protein
LSPEKTRELVWHAIQHHLPIDFSLVVALRFIHQHHQPTIVEKGKGKGHAMYNLNGENDDVQPI